ncbi:benenodin family lasso peptide [Caulobacter sp. CCH5-E12]|nr:benenodin family lasso peptide [Caulobacter sp. CCH5-E12]
MNTEDKTPECPIVDLGRASAETKGPYTEGPIEIMGHRAPIGLSDD